MEWSVILLLLLPGTLYFAYAELLVTLVGGCVPAVFWPGGPGWPCTFRVISGIGGTLGLASLWALAIYPHPSRLWQDGRLILPIKIGFVFLMVALVAHHFVYVALSSVQPGASILNVFTKGVSFFLLDIYWWLLTVALIASMFYLGRRPVAPDGTAEKGT